VRVREWREVESEKCRGSEKCFSTTMWVVAFVDPSATCGLAMSVCRCVLVCVDVHVLACNVYVCACA
jgi:hypothetical protein